MDGIPKQIGPSGVYIGKRTAQRGRNKQGNAMVAINSKYLVIKVPARNAYGIYDNALLSADVRTPDKELLTVTPLCVCEWYSDLGRRSAKARAEYIRILLEKDEKELSDTSV